MKPGARQLALFTAVTCIVVLLVLVMISAPKPPVALIRVVDAAGNPIVGAVIKPDGLRTKPGPYGSGHYGWRADRIGVPNDPVVTDKNGYGRVPYPKYVFERIETGQISFSVNHPDFVPDRPFRFVSFSLPAGAPWRERAKYAWARIQRKALIVRPDPVVLERGATLKLSVRSGPADYRDRPLFAQVSSGWGRETNFWIRPEPGVIVTRRLAAGTQAVRAVWFDAKDSAWFSEVVRVAAVVGQTNELSIDLQKGIAVRGQLDASVPRPIKNGRVVAHVWPQAHKAEDSPPQWHAWTAIREDGSFEIGSLPQGVLELVALCQGFVSTNGPGQFQMHYPQTHLLETNDIAVTIGMEATARLEVRVTDDRRNPLKDARVVTWPNVRYGEWSATVLASDCYNSSDGFLSKVTTNSAGWFRTVPDFEGTSDASGLAVLPNVPATVKEFSVEHVRFTLPAVETGGSGKRRLGSVKLIAGQTNHVSVQLEPQERAPIAHY